MTTIVSSSGATEQFNGNTTINVPMPAGVVAGNLLMLIGHALSNATISQPSGWTILDLAAFDPSSGYIGIYYKIATASDVSAGNLTVSYGSGGSVGSTFTILQLNGQSGAPYGKVRNNYTTTSGPATTFIAPSATALNSSDILIDIFCMGQISSISAEPSDVTIIRRETYNNNGTPYPLQNVYYKQLAVSGATGTRSIVWSGAAYGYAVALLIPAGVSGSAIFTSGSPTFSASGVISSSAIFSSGVPAFNTAALVAKVAAITFAAGTPSFSSSGVILFSASILMAAGAPTFLAAGIRTIVTLWTAVVEQSSIWTEDNKDNSIWTKGTYTPTAWSG